MMYFTACSVEYSGDCRGPSMKKIVNVNIYIMECENCKDLNSAY